MKKNISFFGAFIVTTLIFINITNAQTVTTQEVVPVISDEDFFDFELRNSSHPHRSTHAKIPQMRASIH